MGYVYDRQLRWLAPSIQTQVTASIPESPLQHERKFGILPQHFTGKKLKAITLICAVAFAANILMGLYNLSQYVSRMSGAHLPPIYVASQAIWIGAQCALVAFFITLYARQK